VTLRRRAAAACAVASLLTLPSALPAQVWVADLYAGGTRYDPLAGYVSTTNLIGNLRFRSVGGAETYLSLAAPLGEGAALWGAAGAAHTLLLPVASRVSIGVLLGADGYAFDDPGGSLAGGGALHALPLVRLAGEAASLELSGGGHEHLFNFPDTSGSRGVIELSARGLVELQGLGVQAEARWLSADEGSYPWVGAQLATPPGAARLWVWGGKWLAETLDDVEWGVGGSLSVGPLGELWVTVRQDGADPLYEGSQRRAWNVGFSRQLGGPRSSPASLVPRVSRGAVSIRLPADLLPADGGTPSVAGEFSRWEPLAMTRVGTEWVLDLPLEAGAYRFAFVSPAGEWFVPERYPGRLEDGFGGFVALLVVP
jgi:hypothetical protein